MSGGRVFRREAAGQDLIDHAWQIASEAGAAWGEKFLEEAEETLVLLSGMPLIGARTRFRNELLSEVRKWPVSRRFRNHLFFYLPRSDGIDLLYVFHASRNFEAILEAVGELPR
jgi:plasmid stabilization system protein ParE